MYNHLNDKKNRKDESIALDRRNILKKGAGMLAAVPLLAAASSVVAQTLGGTQSVTNGKTPSRTTTNINASLAGQLLIGGDFKVNRLGYGALKITGPGVWGEPERREEAIQLLRRLPELGVNFIDTADAYGPFISEDLIAEALAPYQGFPYNGALIATKGGFVRPDDVTDPWIELGDPNYLQQCVRMSMRRLKVDHIDLWQLHRVDPKVPQDVQFKAIRSFLDKGLIRHAGLSEVSIAQIEEAKKYFPVVSVQNRYNLIERGHEEVLNYCEDNGIVFIPWWPLENGKLAQPGGPADTLAKAKGATPAQIAIAWLLKRSPVMLPIPGTSRLAHLEENVAAAAITITDDEFEALDRLTRPNR
jgi:pyridoxine 4-dehydrogenase